MNLAGLCPFTDGNQIYNARTFYNFYYEKDSLFENNCFNQGSRLAQSIAEAFVSLYPNPSNGQIILQNQGKSDLILSVKITDISGKVIHEIPFMSISKESLLNTQLSQGLYFIQLTNLNSHESITEKVVIIQ